MDRAIRHTPATFEQITEAIAGQPVTKRPKIVSLFSGCGGMDLGFVGGFEFMGKVYDKTAFQLVWANDIDRNACETYRHNLKHEILCKDIAELDIQSLPKADVLLGGFPCQDFSVAGKRRGMSSPRGRLYQFMVDAVKRCEPKVFVAENVKGMLSIPGVLETIKSGFSEAGYQVDWRVLNAKDFMVPQTRERVIIVGKKPRINFVWPEKIEKEISAQAAIQDLEEVAVDGVNGHVWSKAKRITGQGQNAIKADRPSTAIRAEHHGHIEFHYKLDRRLSAREAARLQSFPDSFELISSTSQSYRQIGNAIPPVMAWHLANAVLDAIQ